MIYFSKFCDNKLLDWPIQPDMLRFKPDLSVENSAKQSFSYFSLLPVNRIIWW